ncbi:hypothetical protein ACFQ9Y_06400 [Peribacillus simplex]|uniref:hypothetical protein n=1 Tax=Peribacillus simplex TaxID=1478 RepID=UPI00366CB3FB
MQSPCILEANGQFFLVTEIDDDVATLRIRISALLASTLIGLVSRSAANRLLLSQHFFGIPLQ